MTSTNVLSVHDARIPEAVHWVLVADAGRAQLFAADLLVTQLIALEGHVHPESRLPARELVAGDRGATRDHATQNRSRFERHTDPHSAVVDEFARELAGVLRQGRLDNRYERLVLVAPPAFLGSLRGHLDGETHKHVLATVHHNWTGLPLADLTTRVRDSLPQTLP